MAVGQAHELEGFALRMQRLLYRLMRDYETCDQACVSQYSVTAAQAYTLLALPASSSVTMNELSIAMGLANSTMTRMADQLVRKGLVQRRNDDEDRRVVRVSLTSEGRQVQATLERSKQEYFLELLRAVPEEERPAILRSLETVTRLVSQAVERCCCE